MQELSTSDQTATLPEPAISSASSKPQRSWWDRLMKPEPPDPRKAIRECLPGLASYFWTGGVPVAHPIRDISLTGLYVVTEERWYPGTEVVMTLTKADWVGDAADHSISLRARAVRWGSDGVGLGFMLAPPKAKNQSSSHMADEVDMLELHRFLARLKAAQG
jgi:hypothetical protein